MEKENKSKIATNLLKIREHAGYSREVLAGLIGIDVTLIEKWESGEVEPTISQVLLLSSLYGVSIDDMFCECKVVEMLPEDKKEEFNHNAWLNRIMNRRYCW